MNALDQNGQIAINLAVGLSSVSWTDVDLEFHGENALIDQKYIIRQKFQDKFASVIMQRKIDFDLGVPDKDLHLIIQAHFDRGFNAFESSNKGIPSLY